MKKVLWSVIDFYRLKRDAQREAKRYNKRGIGTKIVQKKVAVVFSKIPRWVLYREA